MQQATRAEIPDVPQCRPLPGYITLPLRTVHRVGVQFSSAFFCKCDISFGSPQVHKLKPRSVNTTKPTP